MDKILVKIKKYIPQKIFKALQPAYHFLMSWLAALVYRRPSEEIIVIGVTGTTGKTTSVYLIAKMLEAAGFKSGFTSTAIFNDGAKEWLNDKKMTMVGRFFTQKILRRMIANSCRYAIVETTSEGIKQYRHRFINYDILVFTGLYPEHIEAHGDFKSYKNAKGKLFTHLTRCQTKYIDSAKKVVISPANLKKLELNRVKKTIIVNGDDEHKDYFLSFWAEAKIIFINSTEVPDQSNDIKQINYRIVKVSQHGTGFSVQDEIINLQLVGEFNVQNAMVAVAVGLSQGLDIKDIKAGLESIEGVAGRLERIDEGQDFTVIVDYAFEPNAIKKLYQALKLIPHQRIIHVLGSAGGGRDKTRRSQLGELAGRNADYVIITDEDPYDDDPKIIIDQIAQGALEAGKIFNTNLDKIYDRREAIKKALNLAESNDLVLITGKGSEQFICQANGEKIPWDDRAVTRGLLHELKNGK